MRDHGQMDAVGPHDVGQRLAGIATLERLGALVVRELELAAEPHAISLGTLAAGGGPFLDQVALEFGNGGEYRREQPALGR